MDQTNIETSIEEEAKRMEGIDLSSVMEEDGAPKAAEQAALPELQGEEELEAGRKAGGAAGTKRKLCGADKKRRRKLKAELAAGDGSSASAVGTVPEVASSTTKVAEALGKRQPCTNETPPSVDRVRKKPKGATVVRRLKVFLQERAA